MQFEEGSTTSLYNVNYFIIEMGNNLDKKHIVYLTMNIVNKKFYIGVHSTETPNKFDGYLGCGAWIDSPSSYNKGKTPLHNAILKYGIKSFVRKTLKIFDTREEALKLESDIVTEKFIKRTDVYNAVIGGGDPPLLTKTVYQFDLKGNLLKKWNSETEIRKFYECKISISDIIKSKRSFAGSLWSFSTEIDINDFKTECNRGFIAQYNSNGVLLNTFKNTTLAAQVLDLDRQAITRAVFKKKLYAGYYFLNLDVDIAEVLSSKYKPKLGKQLIYRYLEDGTFDTEFESITEATNKTGLTRGKIPYALINGKICGGYRWSYYKAQNYFEILEPNKKPEVKIAQYDKENSLIKIWNSPKECKKEFPYALQVCQGKAKSTKGYVFKYIQD